MTLQLLILCILGIALCGVAYFLSAYPILRNWLLGFGILFLIAPIALLLYFLVVLFQLN